MNATSATDSVVMRFGVTRLGKHLGFGPLLAGFLFLTAFSFGTETSYVTENPWGTECSLEWCEENHIQKDSLAGLDVAALKSGRECWNPDLGIIPNDIIVKDSVTGKVSIIPFTDEAFNRAVNGEFETLWACK